MNEQELLSFVNYYNNELEAMNYNMYVESKANDFPGYGLLPKMYFDKNPLLLSLLCQPCDHDELKKLLMRYLDKTNGLNSLVSSSTKNKNMITEPIHEWIFNYNYMLAYPLCGCDKKDDRLLISDPERILSYVYINLRIQFFTKEYDYSFQQPLIDTLYKDRFDKSSAYGKWGLIPIDEERFYCVNDEPVRIYDKSVNRTIFIMINRPLALIFNELITNQYIGTISFRGINNRIYNGENHFSTISEAVEKGRIFSFDLSNLPHVTKLFRESSYADTLWVLKDDSNITFEELCNSFHTDNDTIVTQMIHLEYNSNNITHLDHEFIFYTLEEYELRINNPYSKGNARKRVKTFKIDKSSIPMNYPCQMFTKQGSSLTEIEVPFLYFVLDNYFEHKELLTEYFSECL